MALVDYSDSEGSEDEQPKPAQKPASSKPAPAANSKFSIDRANPQKIKVQLHDSKSTNGTHEDEPAAKRPRIGGGGFSGFNALLPPPKRDAEKPQATTSKAPARKVFSLKTGAEPGFSRDSDAELRQLFAEQDTTRGEYTKANEEEVGIPDIPNNQPAPLPKPSFGTQNGNPFMFKPLSVARNAKPKKKPINPPSKAASSAPLPPTSDSETKKPAQQPKPPPKKVSLFSSGDTVELPEPVLEEVAEADPEDELYNNDDYDGGAASTVSATMYDDPQNLDAIASDLNLSAGDRRQLFGRGGKGNSATAVNVMNFNTDREYAANQEAIANGEQVQHNPVRAIAPGKHSLRQLVSAAQGQKDALEESFSTGKRNKKEAGNRYGW